MEARRPKVGPKGGEQRINQTARTATVRIKVCFENSMKAGNNEENWVPPSSENWKAGLPEIGSRRAEIADGI